MSRFLSWLKGVWTGFCRLLKRNFFPNRIRYQNLQDAGSKNDLPSVTGIEKFGNFSSLSVSSLMDKVKWKTPKTPTVKKSLKGKINWD